MSITPHDGRSDQWSRWLLRDRHGGDPVHEKSLRAAVDPYAERVLEGARLGPDMTLVDVGTGDGLVAFRALQAIGPSLRAILTDISAPLLRHTRDQAAQRGVLSQCVFLEGSAERLVGIDSGSADAVASRAVLAYVADKRAALLEFHRVLKPGGRVSLAEPVLQDDALNAIALRNLIHAPGAEPIDPMLPLIHRWKAAQFPDTPEALAASPICNYSERDLLTLVQNSGFVEIHLELHIDVRACEGVAWETFLASSPHPWAPTLGAILAERFSAEESERFERVLRPLVETGVPNSVDRVVFLTAVKPSPA